MSKPMVGPDDQDAWSAHIANFDWLINVAEKAGHLIVATELRHTVSGLVRLRDRKSLSAMDRECLTNMLHFALDYSRSLDK